MFSYSNTPQVGESETPTVSDKRLSTVIHQGLGQCRLYADIYRPGCDGKLWLSGAPVHRQTYLTEKCGETAQCSECRRGGGGGGDEERRATNIVPPSADGNSELNILLCLK